jgi:hypothetical protein
MLLARGTSSSPAVGRSIAAIILSRVVLPEPDGPIRATKIATAISMRDLVERGHLKGIPLEDLADVLSPEPVIVPVANVCKP